MISSYFVIFDFDGVIANSFALAFEIQKKICHNITEEVYLKGFEGNINDWKKPVSMHDAKCRHEINFSTEYAAKMRDNVSIFDGMKEVIVELGACYNIIIISSSPTHLIRDFIEKYHLDKSISDIMGNDVHASKEEKMRMLFQRYHTQARHCVFITDTLGDMYEAKRMGVDVMGVTWGFHSPETLQLAVPLQLIAKPADLSAAVAAYFEAHRPSTTLGKGT